MLRYLRPHGAEVAQPDAGRRTAQGSGGLQGVVPANRVVVRQNDHHLVPELLCVLLAPLPGPSAVLAGDGGIAQPVKIISVLFTFHREDYALQLSPNV